MKKHFLLAVLAVAISLSACKPVYKNAQERFELGEFQTSIPLFEAALKKSQHEKEKGKINFYIGEAYRLSNRLDEALPYYETALEEKHYEDKLAFYYGMALKANGRYEDAAKQFNGFTKTGGDAFLVRRAKEELLNLEKTKTLSEPAKYIKVENLSGINSESAEYAPVIWGDKLVFTSTRRNEKVYEATGNGFADIYSVPLADIKNADLSPEAFPAIINVDGFHDATPAFDKDGNSMIFARSNSGHKNEEHIFDVNLYRSQLSNGEWSEPKVLVDVVQNKKWDGTPTYSTDGKTLYFASDRDGGFGGLDIWSTKMNDRGEWTKPRNLGKDINTAGNEMFPHVTEEGVLYFASDGHAGLGGLDVFKAVREEGVITIENLGAPINSPADDFGLVLTAEKEGVFTSNRSGENAKGDDDLYWFIDETPEIKVVNYLLAGISYENKEGEKNILPETTVLLKSPNGELLDSALSDAEGKFAFDVPIEIDTEYLIFGERGKDHFKNNITYSTVGKGLDPETLEDDTTEITFNTEITLMAKVEEIITLEETGKAEFLILYDLNKDDIRPDAAKILDEVVAYLKENPEVRIELGSHTDARGNAKYNLKLSDRRAKSAVKYIVDNGIDKDRLVAKGYGKTDLKIKNARTEEEHEQNRRTTIQVLQEEEKEEE